MARTAGHSALRGSTSSPKARIEATLSPATITQITVKSSHSFFHSFMEDPRGELFSPIEVGWAVARSKATFGSYLVALVMLAVIPLMLIGGVLIWRQTVLQRQAFE